MIEITFGPRSKLTVKDMKKSDLWTTLENLEARNPDVFMILESGQATTVSTIYGGKTPVFVVNKGCTTAFDNNREVVKLTGKLQAFVQTV